MRRICRVSSSWPKPPTVDAAVVRHHFKIIDARLEQCGSNQHAWYPAQPEALPRGRTPARCRRPPRGASDYFVHDSRRPGVVAGNA
jgi:hypothetical protein